MTPTLVFTRTEYQSRLTRVQATLAERDIEALVAFQPETITWITGFFTRAYSGFQLAVIPAIGEPLLLCRDVSAYYAEKTCAYSGVRFWSDGENRTWAAVETIRSLTGATARLGIEAGAWPLNARLQRELAEALPDTSWIDLGETTARFRLIKSPAEIEYQRHAARAAEAGMVAALDATRAGVTERDVAAAASSALIRAGSDFAGPGVMSSGERAHHLHGGPSDRQLQRGDTLQFEPTPHVRHYHARFMRTIKVGTATDAEHDRANRLIAAQDHALASVAPGVPASVPDRLYRQAILDTGLVETYTNKTFYSVGLMMAPTGAEGLEATPASDWAFETGMTFHTYLLVAGFGFSETIAITDDGFERLTRYPRRLLVSM